MEFDLETFLRNHKSVKLDFAPYLKLKKLKGYKLLNRQDIEKLNKGDLYIKYIKESDAFMDEKYKTHVRCGGFLLKGGIYQDGKFKGTKNAKRWTHLMLNRIPHTKQNKEKQYKSHKFVIKISGNYIFYR